MESIRTRRVVTTFSRSGSTQKIKWANRVSLTSTLLIWLVRSDGLIFTIIWMQRRPIFIRNSCKAVHREKNQFLAKKSHRKCLSTEVNNRLARRPPAPRSWTNKAIFSLTSKTTISMFPIIRAVSRKTINLPSRKLVLIKVNYRR